MNSDAPAKEGTVAWGRLSTRWLARWTTPHGAERNGTVSAWRHYVYNWSLMPINHKADFNVAGSRAPVGVKIPICNAPKAISDTMGGPDMCSSHCKRRPVSSDDRQRCGIGTLAI